MQLVTLSGWLLVLAATAMTVSTQSYRIPVRAARVGPAVFPPTFARLQTLRSNTLTPTFKGTTAAVSPSKGRISTNGFGRIRRLVRFGRRRFARLQDSGVKGGDVPGEVAVEKTGDEANGEVNEEVSADVNAEGATANEDGAEGSAVTNETGEEGAAPDAKATAENEIDGATPVENETGAAGDEMTTPEEGAAAAGDEEKSEDEAATNGEAGEAATDADAAAGDEMKEGEAAEGKMDDEEGEMMDMDDMAGEKAENDAMGDNEEMPPTEEGTEADSNEPTDSTPVAEGEENTTENEISDGPSTDGSAEGSTTATPDPNNAGASTDANGNELSTTPESGDAADENEIERNENGDPSISGPSDDLADVNDQAMNGNGSYSFAFNTSAAVEAGLASNPDLPAAPILSRQEQSDDDGNVKGSYGYMDAQGLFRHVQYEADQNGFRAKVTSNEPGLSDHAGNPAGVRLMLQPVPANIQEQYGVSEALRKSNETSADEIMNAIANGTLSEEMVDDMLNNVSMGTGIGGINEDVIKVMTGGSNEDPSPSEDEATNDLTNEANVNENNDAELLNGETSENGETGADGVGTPTEASTSGVEINDEEKEGETKPEEEELARFRTTDKLRRRMLRRYRSKRAGSARRSYRHGGATRLLRRKKSRRSQYAVRLAARNPYYRALRAARVRRLRKSSRSGRVTRRSSVRSARRSSRTRRNRKGLRTRRARRRGAVRRGSRGTSARFAARSGVTGRRHTNRGQHLRRVRNQTSTRRVSRRRSSTSTRHKRRRVSSSRRSRARSLRRLRKLKNAKRRKNVSNRQQRRARRGRRVQATKPVYFATS